MELSNLEHQGQRLGRSALQLGFCAALLALGASAFKAEAVPIALGAAVGTAYLYLSVILVRNVARGILAQPPRALLALGAVSFKVGLFFCFVFFLGSVSPGVIYGALIGLMCIIPAAVTAHRHSND